MKTIDQPDIGAKQRHFEPGTHSLLNPAELEVDLLCKGIRIDPSCVLQDDARQLARTRAGLGSGLELVIPGELKDLWVNVPVEEDFAVESPYLLVKENQFYFVRDAREPSLRYAVTIPPEPEWYARKTSKGIPMGRVGVLQGTYLGIYLSNSCGFWYHQPSLGCKYCTTGLNVGVNEVSYKDVDDVVEVAMAAKQESGNTFVHFNSGFHRGGSLELVAPYIKAVKERVGALIGVQLIPTTEHWKYDWLKDLGVNHFSFCYEFHNPEYFARYLPGKEKLVGQETFFRALEYTSKLMGRGACSGEIIAGVEPIEDTLAAIDYITSVGAFPTVCIFRPVIGAEMEKFPSPSYEDMRHVMQYMYESCKRNNIPIGMAPNIEVSLIVNPDDAKYLSPRNWSWRWYETKLQVGRWLAKPIFRRELRPRTIPIDGTEPKQYRPESTLGN